MNKLILAAAGAVAAGSAAAVLGMGTGNADPAGNSTLNVLGEPYYKAVAILHAQGVSTVFGGSVGGEIPQAKCLVQSQKAINNGKMQLMLNCTKEAQASLNQGSGPAAPAQAPGTDGGARPTPGAPGVVTVTPTQVG